MKCEGAIIRPTSEAYSQLIQVSVGCSHNRCTFCPACKEKIFNIKGFDEIQEDIPDTALDRNIYADCKHGVIFC
jgi:hypothetical protein